MPKDRGAEQGDVDGPWECSLALGWWRLKHEDAWLLSRRQAACHELVLMTLLNNSACKQTTQSDCRTLPTYLQLGGPEKSPEPTTRGMRCKQWRPGGLWYMDDGDILCHPILCRLTCRNSTSPMPKLEQSETHRKRTSSAAWVQHLLNGNLVTCRTWPRSLQ